MGSPGGEEIGRVSLRVLPDTSGLRRDLKRAVEAAEAGLSVTIGVDFDVDTDGLRAQIEALELSKITIPVDLGDGSEIERFRARLRVLDNARITIPVELGDGTEIALLRTQLAALDNQDIRISVELSGAAAAIAELRVLESLVNSLDGRDVRINLNIVGLAGALASLAALQAALAAIGSFGGGGGSGGFSLVGLLPGHLGAAVSLAIGLATALAKASVAAFAVSVAGAGITGAFAAASAAVATLPGVLALVAAPMAAIALGSDAIEKSFKGIKDQLKADVGKTWAAELEPIVKRLADNVMPDLTARLQDTVIAMTDVGEHLTGIAESAVKAGVLKQVFDNVNGAIRTMQPGLADILTSFLDIAALPNVFSPITTAVNEFGRQFRANVTELIGNGQLDAAFQGLADMSGIAARGLADLVTNGIEAFAAAAPGMNHALESLTGFFNRFDWTSLGASVGGVFDGLATALDRVPQSTIDGIAAGFEKLAQTFQSTDFQNQITTMINGLPSALALLDQLVVAFGRIGAGVSIAIQAFQRIGSAIDGFGKIVWGAAHTILQFGRIIGNPVKAWLDGADISAQFDRAGESVRQGVDQLGHAFTDPWPTIGANLSTAVESATTRTIGKNVDGFNQFPPLVAGALEPTPAAAAAALDPTAAAVTGALAPAEAATTASLTRIQSAMQVGFAALAPQVGTQLAGVLTTVTSSFAQIAVIAEQGMIGVGTAITTGSAGWAIAVGTAMTGLNVAVQTGFLALSGSATTGMLGVQTAITTGTAGWSAAVSLGMATLANTLTLGFVGMQTAAANGMLGVELALTTSFAKLATIATTGMLAVAAAITAGFAGVNAGIAAGMAAAVATVTAGMAAIIAAFQINWTAVTTATTTAMATMTAAVQAGMAAIVVASQQGWAQIVAAAIDGATQMVNAITLGMNQSVTAVVSGIARMLNALRSAVPQFRAAGAAMGQGLVDGLLSKLGAVQAAAARLANAAAAAMRAAAQIRSPSRVFMNLGSLMGEGAAIGLEGQEHRIIAAAASIVDGLSAEFKKVDTGQFGGLDARVRAEIADTSGGSSPDMLRALQALRGDTALPVWAAQFIGEMRGLRRDLAAARPNSSAVAQAARTQAELGMF